MRKTAQSAVSALYFAAIPGGTPLIPLKISAAEGSADAVWP